MRRKKSKVDSRKLKAERLKQCRANLLIFAVAFIDGHIDLNPLVGAVREYKQAVQEYERAR